MNRWVLILLLVTVVVNVVAFSFLPERVAIQFGLTGGVTNSAPRAIFVVMTPLVLLALGALSGGGTGNRHLLAAVILAVVNLALVMRNIVRS